MSKYDELMEKVVVTPEMKDRILSNINAPDLYEDRKIIPVHTYRRYLWIASCFLFLLVGAISIPKLLQPQTPHQPPVMSGGISEAENIDALSKAVGFRIEEISDLPFEVMEKTYTSYWDELAQISYKGKNQTLLYRKSKGNEDISGDYTVYGSEIPVTIRNTPVTLKGNENLYTLAIWTNEGYSYSILLTSGISQDEFTDLISSMNW